MDTAVAAAAWGPAESGLAGQRGLAQTVVRNVHTFVGSSLVWRVLCQKRAVDFFDCELQGQRYPLCH
jgi:hypothetical protein